MPEIMSGGTGDEGEDLCTGVRPLDGVRQAGGRARTDLQISARRDQQHPFEHFRHEKVVRGIEGERAFKQEDEEEEPLDRAPIPPPRPKARCSCSRFTICAATRRSSCC